MTRQGWNKSSFKAGDKIVLVVNPLRTGEKAGSLVYAIDKSGKKLYPDTERESGKKLVPPSESVLEMKEMKESSLRSRIPSIPALRRAAF